MEETAKLSVDQIRDLLNKVQDGEIEPYEEDTPEWATALYELCEDDNQIGEDGVLAGLDFASAHLPGESFHLSEFQSLLSGSNMTRFGSKADFGEQHARDFADSAEEAMIDKLKDFVNWTAYAESFEGDYQFVERSDYLYVVRDEPDLDA